MKLNAVMNSGRRAVGSPIAKSGTSPSSLGSTTKSQTKDSGGGTFQTMQYPMAGELKGASKAPITGTIPNTQAVGHLGGIGPAGSGKVTKKVAGIAKFYGR